MVCRPPKSRARSVARLRFRVRGGMESVCFRGDLIGWFTHWCRRCAPEWWQACSRADVALAASGSRGMRATAWTPRRGWLSVAAGSPGLRAGSQAGTRRAGITGAEASSCPSGPGSATGSAPAPRRPPISRLQHTSPVCDHPDRAPSFSGLPLPPYESSEPECSWSRLMLL